VFVINGDTAGDFPLKEMFDFHNKNNCSFTILGTEATEKQSVNYGCIVEDKETHEVLHYGKKKFSFVTLIYSF
jgi:mannose-1-phosphate guanylyltransferase